MDDSLLRLCCEKEVPFLAAYQVVAREGGHWHCVLIQLALHVTCCYSVELLPYAAAVDAEGLTILEATKFVFVASTIREVMTVNLAASHGEHGCLSNCYYYEQPQFLPLFSHLVVTQTLHQYYYYC